MIKINIPIKRLARRIRLKGSASLEARSKKREIKKRKISSDNFLGKNSPDMR